MTIFSITAHFCWLSVYFSKITSWLFELHKCSFLLFLTISLSQKFDSQKKACPYSECCTMTNTKKLLITCSHPVLPFLWISIPLQRGILVLLARRKLKFLHDSRYTIFFWMAWYVFAQMIFYWIVGWLS